MKILIPYAVLAIVTAFLVGCSSDKTKKNVAALNATNIQRVSNLYAAHQTYKNGQGPKNEAEFKQFVRDFDPTKLDMMGIDPANVDAIFVSERDNQPFVIRYQVGGGRGSVDPVVFEQTGVGGKKQVGFTGGKVEEVDDATAEKMLAGRSQSQPPSGGQPSGPPTGGRPSGRPSGAPAGAPKGPKS